MIEIRVGRLEDEAVTALLRPIVADGSAVTPSMRRVDVAAGERVTEQLGRLGAMPVGSATITAAGDLQADFLVSVVVRAADEPATESDVERALLNGMRRLREWGIDRVAMPLLGTGAGNLEVEAAAGVMVPLLVRESAGGATPLDVVIIAESEYEREVLDAALARDAG